jgi:2-dehydro-3-deoxygluconokinase
MLKSTVGPGVRQVLYYRRDSAGSRLTPAHLHEPSISGADVLHVTGITPALSATARAAVFCAVELARGSNVTVTFDPNHRGSLWDHDDAVATYRNLAELADVVLASEAEARMLSDAADLRHVAASIQRSGPAEVVIKRGVGGAAALAGDQWHEVPAVPVTEVDPVGAGDGFCAGYLAGLVSGVGVPRRLELGALAGACAVTSRGDWESLPFREELAWFGGTDVRR